MVPRIDGVEVHLGDIVCNKETPSVAGFTAKWTRVQGWSPDGEQLYIGWAGIVSTQDCKWATDIAGTKFARAYKPDVENRWKEAISLSADLSTEVCYPWTRRELLQVRSLQRRLLGGPADARANRRRQSGAAETSGEALERIFR